jgi:ABC-type oligopeptide transport system ATPase subunit
LSPLSAKRSRLLTKPDVATDSVLVSVRGLKTYYSIRGSFGQRLLGRKAGFVKAVDDVSFDFERARCSGS